MRAMDRLSCTFQQDAVFSPQLCTLRSYRVWGDPPGGFNPICTTYARGSWNDPDSEPQWQSLPESGHQHLSQRQWLRQSICQHYSYWQPLCKPKCQCDTHQPLP